LDFWAEKIMSWFPIYYLAKAIFLVYLSMPQTRGALMIYKNYVDPGVAEIERYMKSRSENKAN
jgi:hypothetical protein